MTNFSVIHLIINKSKIKCKSSNSNSIILSMLGINITVIGNRIIKQSSNPGQGSLHVTSC